MTTQPHVEFYRCTLPETCIAVHSTEGKQIFREALDTGHMDGYFAIAAQFRTQDTSTYCGLTSLVMVLNSLEVRSCSLILDEGRILLNEIRKTLTPTFA